MTDEQWAELKPFFKAHKRAIDVLQAALADVLQAALAVYQATDMREAAEQAIEFDRAALEYQQAYTAFEQAKSCIIGDS